jgi:phosphoserine phosphatase
LGSLESSKYGTVIFDWDSTISAVEGIEELARASQEEVVRLTDAAMRGEVPLEEVYGRRLELAQPSRSSVEELVEVYLEALVPDAADVIRELQSAGIRVRVISGGLYEAVAPAAARLGIAGSDVAAVGIHFGQAGEYAGFDSESPLAYAGGKRKLVQRWRAELPGPIMLVGDGATDLEAKPVVDCFVAFAGVVARAPVLAGADVVIRERSLAPVFTLAAGEEVPTHPAARLLYDKGLALLQGNKDPIHS